VALQQLEQRHTLLQQAHQLEGASAGAASAAPHFPETTTASNGVLCRSVCNSVPCASHAAKREHTPAGTLVAQCAQPRLWGLS
jgi:hypothetical protein